MSPTAENAQKAFDVREVHYQGLFAPPTALPSRKELFDFEVEKLVAGGLAQYSDADPFRSLLSELPNDRFLLVPPPPKELDLSALMGKVFLNGKTGVNYLDPTHLEDPKIPL